METHGISPPLAANFKMIDVGEKPDTRRRAIASGRFFAKSETIHLIRERKLPKGDVLALAEIAGIQGAKNTPLLLPLCHPLPLHSVRIWSKVESESIQLWCEAATVGKTGVEMEALTGVTVALLCMHDLTKMVDPEVRFGDVLLERKEGGKSGSWVHSALQIPSKSSENPALHGKDKAVQPEQEKSLLGKKICVLTISDRCSRAEAEDVSGPLLKNWALARGATIIDQLIVCDDRREIGRQIELWLERENPDAILCSGGTGLSPRDLTPEALGDLSQRLQGREVPGIGELLRSSGAQFTKKAYLSRSLGLFLRGSLVLALPGSAKAVKEGLEAIEPVLAHLLHIGKGGDHVGAHQA